MVSNHHVLRWLKTVVVSDVEKASVRRQVGIRKTFQNRPVRLVLGRASSFEASKPVEMTSKLRSGSVLGMSLAAARVAGQAVSGVEAA